MEMAVLAAVTALAGTAMSAYGAAQQGKEAQRAAKFEAEQMETRAIAQEAAGQQAAEARRRESEVLQSRALAAAGASGAGTVDPDVLRIISGLGVEGERSFQSELFGAREQAELLKSQAGATRFEGAQARQAGNIRATSTALSGISSAATSYFGMPRGSTSAASSPVPIPGRKPLR